MMLFNNVIFITCSGPREDATRIGSACVVRRQVVDISPLRRVNQPIYLLTTGACECAFRNVKTVAECLADKLINAGKAMLLRRRMKLRGLPRLIVKDEDLTSGYSVLVVLFWCFNGK
ncbi:putative ribosomal protein S5/S7 [Helianthus annuus]|uniref:Ribosomal protein S5/S7 n=1 Tax=Helianthus annuus TaxID=4232 RepID=A0A9K3P292_HELAN|nr:putative ribosomal protein S5/S7 [Helianthus annuus]KAJ0605805.1 putative ribosomal protein S5/S7 [Helianthus annuus]KAJ0619799.1 putative ribosomal protein S5/S7 [Helianthus annuus]KAJ0778258.1 putative ribosomal protein S5/S7 [Helianthus annuus]KAJ0787240.1 putative ribosomal protein S5/S7 [Helianthus annuus]